MLSSFNLQASGIHIWGDIVSYYNDRIIGNPGHIKRQVDELMIICGTDIKIRGRLVRIAHPELDKYEPLANPMAMLDHLRNCDTPIDLFTFMQHVPDTAPKYNFPMEWDNLAVLPVSTFENWWNRQISSYPRNRARQAEKKGVIIREVRFDNALAEGMWDVYNESPVRQGRRNVHYGKDVQRVYKEEATFLERSIFIGAFLGGKLIGFVKLVTDNNGTRANMMNIVAMVKHRDKAVTNALVAQSVRSCAERGIRYLAYQNFTYGNKRPDSLSHFKEVNGFKRIDLPRYYIPFTPLGRIALRLGFHHRLLDRLPEPLANKLREIRCAWYNRKLQAVTEAS